jgi:hypothetical protein
MSLFQFLRRRARLLIQGSLSGLAGFQLSEEPFFCRKGSVLKPLISSHSDVLEEWIFPASPDIACLTDPLPSNR